MRWLCSWVIVVLGGPVVRADDTEDAAAKWVGSVGGRVTRDEKAAGKPVVSVDLGFCKTLTDDGLKNLKGFKNVKHMSLFFNEQLTDKGMAHVGALTTLEKLMLGNTGVGDAGIAELKGLTKLKSLAVTGCGRVTDKSAATISGFTELTELTLPYTYTDKGVTGLVGLKKVTVLYVGGAVLSDVAVKHIAETMPDLRDLNLTTFGGTEITDSAVPYFAKLTKLKVLSIKGSKLTADGLKALGEKLPDCRISAK